METRELYVEATQAYIQGDKARARRLLDELVSMDAGNELAWLLLADAATTPKEAKECLNKVLAINPHSSVAKRKLNEMLRTAGHARRTEGSVPSTHGDLKQR